jgi:hypothetical protein
VLFFKNREQYGPGFQGNGGDSGELSIAGEELVLAVEMGSKDCQFTLIPDAVAPEEPFVRWAGYREDWGVNACTVYCNKEYTCIWRLQL